MKKNNVNEQRRDFLKKTSLGVAGSALSGGMVGIGGFGLVFSFYCC